ncbi:DVU0524 family FlgM-associated protein [Megalodesulfovibrio paquesii]
MTLRSLYMRNMLRGYDRQLVTGRRLARYTRSLHPPGTDEEANVARELKRRALVERVAREIVENLILSGSDNPLVAQITSQLKQEFGNGLSFAFPPSEQDLQVFFDTPSGPREVAPHEKVQILNRLWQITLDKVDETML